MEVITHEVVKRVGMDITVKILSGLSSSAHGIYGLLYYIQNESKTKIGKELEDTDVKTTIKILENFISELYINENTPETIIFCIKKVHNTLVNIENNLKLIYEKIKYNNSLWVLSSMRSYNFNTNIKNIKKELIKLENKKKLLFDTLKLSNTLKKGNNNNKIFYESWVDNKNTL